MQAAHTAQQCIDLARRRGNRVAECRAALVLARAHARGEAGAPPEGTDARDWLARAGELLDETGADLWRPMWRALQVRARARAGAAV